MARKSFVFEKIYNWRHLYPEKKKADCCRELNLSFFTISKYWDKCGFETTLLPKDAVKNWREKHPNGIIAACMEDTKLSRDTVKKYWTLDLK